MDGSTRRDDGATAATHASPTRAQRLAPNVAFRVMRLRAPSYEHAGASSVGTIALRVGDFDVKASERVGGAVGGSVGGDVEADERDVGWRASVSDAATAGELVLPQSFGSVALGERFSSFVTFGNFSHPSGGASTVVREVGIKIELQTERKRETLYDGTKTPLKTLAPGEKKDITVTKDLKELGPHTLVCSATYFDDYGERKYLPQYFKFKVANPLSVRTKTRALPRGRIFLEVCIENATRHAMLLDDARFDTVEGIEATVVTPEFGGQAVRLRDAPNSGHGLPSLGNRTTYQLDPNIGAAHFLFEITRAPGAADAGAPFASQTPLGKLELRWRGAMGDPGRLQTQIISAGSAGSSDPTPSTAKITQKIIVDPKPRDPSTVYLETPFTLRVVVEALKPSFADAYVVRVKDISSGVYIDGPRTHHIPPALTPGQTHVIDISCVALGLGIQTCPTLLLVGAVDDVTHDAPKPLEVFCARPVKSIEPSRFDVPSIVPEPPVAVEASTEASAPPIASN
jgi:hypothetical protein